MADFDQDVTIDLNVDTEGIESSLTSAVAEIEGAQSALEGLDETSKDSDIKIGGQVDRSDISEAVASAQTFAQLEVGMSPNPTVPIGGEVDPGLIKEVGILNSISDIGSDAAKAKEDVAEANMDLGEQAKASVKELDKENDSFDNIIDSGDSLTEIKEKVAAANRNVQKMSLESARALDTEDGSVMRLLQDLDTVEDKMDSSSESQIDFSKATRRARRSVDESRDSLRAAAQVGDLFEDGLGSLSLNLGAFTIALRNFLTQIPLILTGLGALGAAATAAAAAFGTLALSVGGILGAGLIAHLQEIESRFASVEDMGEAIQVVMQNLIDVFMRAIEPLTEMEGTVDIFARMISGIATAINMVSQMIKQLFEGTDELRAFAEAGDSTFVSIQEAIKSFDGDAFREILSSLMQAWALLGEEVLWALGAAAEGLADAISRSAELLNNVDDLGGAMGQFGDTISELAEVGFAIGGGLLPVFEAFSSVVEQVAGFVADLDSEMVQNAVTFGALFVAIDKVSGTLGSIVNIGPSVVFSMKKIGTAVGQTDSAVAALDETATRAGANIAGFLADTGPLSGMGTLTESVLGFDEGMRAVALSTSEGQDQLSDLTHAVVDADGKVGDLGDEIFSATGEFVDFGSSTEELHDELRRLTEQGVLTSEVLESADFDVSGDAAVDMDEIDTDNIDDAAVSTLELADVKETLSLKSGKAKKATSALNTATFGLSTRVNELAGKLMTSLIPGLNGYTASALLAKLATYALDTAITVLTAGLNKVLAAVVLLTVTIGALAVGIIKNFGDIKGAFAGLFNVIAAIVGAIVELLMTVFVSVWDAVRMTIEPILRPVEALAGVFDSAGSSGKNSANVIGEYWGYLLDILSAAIRVIGFLGKIIVTVLILPLEVVAVAIGVVISAITMLLDMITVAIAAFFGAKDSVGGFMDALFLLVDALRGVFNWIMESFEELVNGVIDIINGFIQKLNKFPFFEVAEMGKVDLTREEAGAGKEGEAEPEPEGDNVITYNEDNSTNIDQTVNADPEDQAQLSRVVTDAIDEANSFERRRQGGQ